MLFERREFFIALIACYVKNTITYNCASNLLLSMGYTTWEAKKILLLADGCYDKQGEVLQCQGLQDKK